MPDRAATPTSTALYVEALYFLTGEHRPYSKHGGSGAAFTRVVPNSNYFFVGGDGGNLFSRRRLAGRRPLLLDRPQATRTIARRHRSTT